MFDFFFMLYNPHVTFPSVKECENVFLVVYSFSQMERRQINELKVFWHQITIYKHIYLYQTSLITVDLINSLLSSFLES